MGMGMGMGMKISAWVKRSLAAGFSAVMVLVGGTAVALAADSIGRIKEQSGMVTVERDGITEEVALGQRIYQNDRFITGPEAAVGMIFEDDTRFSIGPDSEVVLDQFVYEPRENRASFFTQITRGSASYISGKVAKVNPDNVGITTPVATIGIRGTKLALDLGEGAGEPKMRRTHFKSWIISSIDYEVHQRVASFILLPDDDGSVGAFTVKNNAGSHTLNQANQVVQIASADTQPEEAAQMTEEQRKEVFGTAIAHLPAPPDTFRFYFQSGSTSLTAESNGQMPAILEALNSRKAPDILLTGHTDRTGSDALNMRLSDERAQTVREILLQGGIPGDAISTAYRGESEPIVPTADGVAEPQNRRVEVLVR